MAAGMHFARGLRGPGGAGQFFHRQGIHIGAQADGAAIRPALAMDDADDAGAGETGDHLITAECAQALGHDAGGAVLLETQLRVHVEIPPPCGEFGVEFGDTVDHRHGVAPAALDGGVMIAICMA